MSEFSAPYLCGGTFFFLLLQAKYKIKTSSRDHINGIKEEMADRNVMDMLVYAINGQKSYCVNSTLKKDTSAYRECRINGSINIPFNDVSTTSTYFNGIKNKNPEILKRMTEFVDEFIDPEKFEWLTRSILEIVEEDEISCDEQFYITTDGIPVTKSDMLKIDKFEIQPFISGIMLYIMQNRTDNSLGVATLNAWGERKGNQERKLTNQTLGTRFPHKITVVKATVPCEEETVDEPQNITDMNETEFIEAEVVDDEPSSGAATDNQTTNIIQNQTNVVQNGPNNFNFTNTGVVNFNFGGGNNGK